MEKQKILIVDDESRMRKLVRDFLERSDFEVVEAADGVAAVALFEQDDTIDLLIVDVMMPFMDGYEVCKRIRAKSKVPIIMLTAKSDEADELKGFEHGVDEYIAKPFRPKVLVARVEAILKRATIQSVEPDVLSYGGIEVDKVAHRVTIEGENVELSFKEFELLTYFMNRIGVALSREIILDQVWNYDYYGDARTIDTHVKKLRNKLGGKGELIKTVWGMGYKFEE
ncbi:MAG: response regulator transcription factor [Eubacteriales bacterium]